MNNNIVYYFDIDNIETLLANKNTKWKVKVILNFNQ